MLISKKWLQSYFDVELPSAQKIADTLMLHSFEIEDVFEHDNGDWIIDIDVLPNRAHDCLCHEGIARELAGLLTLDFKWERYSNVGYLKATAKPIPVQVKSPDQCYRYMAHVVENIEVRESPEWLKNRLTSMGQKSINALVDATNYVMFDIGQPMHVFDADKVVGGIIVRNAESGETIKTLSGEDIELLETDLVICDNEGILALAGVKGGTRAEVTTKTKNIIIESANFNPTTTRQTARRVKILTDASKRYENGISSHKVLPAMRAMWSMVYELAGTDETNFTSSKGVESIDHIYTKPEKQFVLCLEHAHIVRLLGFDMSVNDVSEILEKFDYTYDVQDGVYTIIIPDERLDLRIPEDMIEEIGRLYGYHNIPALSVSDLQSDPQVNQLFYIQHALRNYFVEKGFTEVMNYTFVNKGEVSVLNPLASNKKALRKNLSKQMKEALEKNARLVDFVHIPQVLNFEIDTVHTKDGEQIVCCFGIDTVSKKSRKKFGDEQSQIDVIISEIQDLFGIQNLDYTKDGYVVSFPISQLIYGDHDTYGNVLQSCTYSSEAQFIGISSYPYMKRDISFWARGYDVDVFQKAIQNSGATFLQKHKVFLFDTFEKDGKTSYAFSMIFQSMERTLTDADVDADMKLINQALEDLGVEIR